MGLDIQVSKLKLAKANYLSERYDLEDKIIKYYPMKILLKNEFQIIKKILKLQKMLNSLLV